MSEDIQTNKPLCINMESAWENVNFSISAYILKGAFIVLNLTCLKKINIIKLQCIFLDANRCVNFHTAFSYAIFNSAPFPVFSIIIAYSILIWLIKAMLEKKTGLQVILKLNMLICTTECSFYMSFNLV